MERGKGFVPPDINVLILERRQRHHVLAFADHQIGKLRGVEFVVLVNTEKPRRQRRELLFDHALQVRQEMRRKATARRGQISEIVLPEMMCKRLPGETDDLIHDIDLSIRLDTIHSPHGRTTGIPPSTGRSLPRTPPRLPRRALRAPGLSYCVVLTSVVFAPGGA